MRDHLIELRLQSVTADPLQHRAALAASLGDEFLAECVADMGRAHLGCALASANEAALAACARPGS